MFESEFLTSSEDSKSAFQRVISQTADIVWQSFPSQPYSGRSPQVLRETFGDSFFPTNESSWDAISASLRQIVANSVAVSHPRTAAHLHCPPLLAALAAEVVISALNQSMDSFDQAPIASIVEQKMIRWLCGEIGLPQTSGGTFTTGGSQSNYMGLLLARDAFLQKQWNWSAQKLGLPPQARRLRILCSEVAHFTVEKSASELGLGTDAVLRIEVDDNFRMKPALVRSALETLKSEDLMPMAIVATAGTTNFGSIDPIPEISALAQGASIWLHVDGAFGGALLFSTQYRSKLAGLERADSVSIDFHKLFWQPIPCSAFFVREARHFDWIKLHADYLNPQFHVEQGIPDLVTTSLLTSRRFDALKLWISFQSLGRQKLGAMIERTITLARHATEVIRATSDFELMCEPQLNTVVFRYLPDSDSQADRINTAIRQRLFDCGAAVIGHTRVRGHQCLKFTCMNPTTTERDLEELIEVTRQEGNKLASTRDS